MSIIYDALKKVESKKEYAFLEDIPVAPKPSVWKKKKKAASGKKIFALLATLILLALGAFLLYTNLARQKRENKIDPGRVYRDRGLNNQTAKDIVLKKESVREYILEGIIYDGEASAAIINGKVVRKMDTLGIFRIDKISENNVEMSNTEDNNKVTLSLP